MIHADHTYTLPVGPAEAFAYLSNPANEVEWQNACIAAQLLGDAPGIGCRYVIAFNFLGRKMHFACEITEFEVNQGYAFKTLEGDFHFEGRYTIRPHPDGTEVHWQFAAEPGKFFGILPAALLRKVLISQIEKDAIGLAHRFRSGAMAAV